MNQPTHIDHLDDPILAHWSDLLAFALSRTGGHRQDAEDLVSDTLLSAYAYLHAGGKIEHPRTWLTSTLLHKHNSRLRKKYRSPYLISFDALGDRDLTEPPNDLSPIEEAYIACEEAEEVRRAVCYLGHLHREVVVRYYYCGQSVAAIAGALDIPEGTVKSRLSDGRARIGARLSDVDTKPERKQPMEHTRYIIPGYLNIAWSGYLDEKNNPFREIEGRLIEQNLLLCAYEHPRTVPELADMLGIPTVYLEPIVRRLVDAAFMVEGDRGRVYTNFIIYTPDPDRAHAAHLALKALIDTHWKDVAAAIEQFTRDIRTLSESLPPERMLTDSTRMKLERYALLDALQRCEWSEIESVCGGPFPAYPPRPDGGRWVAMGWAVPGDRDRAIEAREDELMNYHIMGGLRRSTGTARPRDPSLPDTSAIELTLCEFDTPFWDSPRRFIGAYDMATYFTHMPALLWHLGQRTDAALLHDTEEDSLRPFPSTLLEGVPQLIEHGLLACRDGCLMPAVPILSHEEFKQLTAMTDTAVSSLRKILGPELRDLIKRFSIRVPAHLDETAVPPHFRYKPATECFAMTVVRRAYDEGIHMKGVASCCPPVVLIYTE